MLKLILILAACGFAASDSLAVRNLQRDTAKAGK